MISIDWQKCNGLIPVIVQDSESCEVLMLAYMNEQAFDFSIKSGFTHFYSRSKMRIWKKGEVSGNTQKIVSISIDCDSDTLLIKVIQKGMACHSGHKSCFFKTVDGVSTNTEFSKEIDYGIIDKVYHTILDRKLNYNKENSYVASLFSKGDDAILKKVIEEAGEFILSVKESVITNGNNKESVVYEATDLCFHTLIALALLNIDPDTIKQELLRRFGLSGLEEKRQRKIDILSAER